MADQDEVGSNLVWVNAGSRVFAQVWIDQNVEIRRFKTHGGVSKPGNLGAHADSILLESFYQMASDCLFYDDLDRLFLGLLIGW